MPEVVAPAAPAITPAPAAAPEAHEGGAQQDKKPMGLKAAQAKAKAGIHETKPAVTVHAAKPEESKAEVKIDNDTLSRLTLLEAENRRLKAAAKPKAPEPTASTPSLKELADAYKKSPKEVIKQLAGVEDADGEMDRLLAEYVKVPGQEDDKSVKEVEELRASVAELKRRDDERQAKDKDASAAQQKADADKFVGDILEHGKAKYPRCAKNRAEAVDAAVASAPQLAKLKGIIDDSMSSAEIQAALTQEVVAALVDEAFQETEKLFEGRAKAYSLDEPPAPAKTGPENVSTGANGHADISQGGRPNSVPTRESAQSTPSTLPRPGVSTTPTPGKMSLKQAIEKAKERARQLT